MCPAGSPGSWTTFSAVPVLPAIGIGKLAEDAVRRPERRVRPPSRGRRGRPRSAAGSTPTGLRRVGSEAPLDDGRLPVRCGGLDVRDDVRRDELAAVRDHRVEARHLQRRHLQVLLADRELDRVARLPERSICQSSVLP